MDFDAKGNYSYDPATWAIRGAASAAASRGAVLASADATLTPAGAREYAARLLAAAIDAEAQAS
jgi:hypothetical protein